MTFYPKCIEENSQDQIQSAQHSCLTNFVKDPLQERRELTHFNDKPPLPESGIQSVVNQTETRLISQVGESSVVPKQSFVPYFLQLSEENEEVVKHFNLEAEKKNQAQIQAAKRCLQTNAVLGLLFLLALVSIMMYSRERRAFFSCLVFTIMKSSLPVFTTIANYGTVQFVIFQYWQYLKKSSFFQYLS